MHSQRMNRSRHWFAVRCGSLFMPTRLSFIVMLPTSESRNPRIEPLASVLPGIAFPFTCHRAWCKLNDAGGTCAPVNGVSFDQTCALGRSNSGGTPTMVRTRCPSIQPISAADSPCSDSRARPVLMSVQTPCSKPQRSIDARQCRTRYNGTGAGVAAAGLVSTATSMHNQRMNRSADWCVVLNLDNRSSALGYPFVMPPRLPEC